MLPPFIIEQIRKREEEERARNEQQQPQLELPIPRPRTPATTPSSPEDGGERGVIIVELL